MRRGPVYPPGLVIGAPRTGVPSGSGPWCAGGVAGGSLWETKFPCMSPSGALGEALAGNTTENLVPTGYGVLQRISEQQGRG